MEQLAGFLHDNFLWFAGLGIVVYMLSNEARSRARQFEIEPEQLSIKIHQGFKVYDIRDKESYHQGHISQAKHTSIDYVEKSIKRTIDQKKPGRFVIVSENGNVFKDLMNNQNAEQLEIYTLRDGFQSWTKAGLQCEEVAKT